MKLLCIIILLLGMAGPASGEKSAKWVFTDYPPVNFLTEDGQPNGFLHDIVVEVFNQGIGIQVDIAVYPWKRCQAMIRED